MAKTKDRKQALTDEAAIEEPQKPFGSFLADVAAGRNSSPVVMSTEEIERAREFAEKRFLSRKKREHRMDSRMEAVERRIDAMEQDSSAPTPAAVLRNVDGEIVCAKKPGGTEETIKADYKPLLREVQDVRRYIDKKCKEDGQMPTAAEVCAAFIGKALYLFGEGRRSGYATEQDIQSFLRSTVAPYEFTRNLMHRVHRVERSTVDDYVKPGRKNKRKS